MSYDDEILAVFRAEVSEHLEALAQIFDTPSETWQVRDAFRHSHNMKGASRMVGAHGVMKITHALEDLFSVVREGRELDDQLVELARRGSQLLEERFENLGDEVGAEIDEYLEEVTRALGDSAPREPSAAPPSSPLNQPPPDQPPPDSSALEDETLEDGGEQSEAVHQDSSAGAAQPTPGQRALGETVRVTTDKLDRLMGLSAEMSLNGRAAHHHLGMVRQLRHLAYRLSDERPELRQDDDFSALIDTVTNLHRSVSQNRDRQGKFARELHETARQLRMVPLNSVATIFSRVVRQACRTTGRRARFHLEGGETELDRSVLDQVRDPLVHLLRNAIAHGIEDEDARIAAGKPATGEVLLRARSAGAWVELEVRDDGAGLDYQAIGRRAVERGLIKAEEVASVADADLERLLFAPGFSATHEVSELAGRGVGLDVVETNLTRLGGKITVENRPGNGASFVLRVPLTRLTSKMLLVRLGAHNMLLPLSGVVTTARISSEDLEMADGQQVVAIEGEPVVVAGLETLIDVATADEQVRPGVLVDEQGRRRLFLVDEVVGEEELVIQSLSWNLQHLEIFAGSAVLADGAVALVLDLQAMLGGSTGSVDADWLTGARERARQRKILVVDDSVTSRTLIENILSSAGYAVAVAVDGQQAAEICGDEHFDLVITDVEMPRLDGFGLVEKLRTDQATSRVPVIMVTSLGQEEHKQRAAEIGADEYIVKGAFDQDTLLSAVGRLL